jgi:hypothetical protein
MHAAFVDYRRELTPEGGIRITYKDYDVRLRHMIWSVFAWYAATGFECWLINTYSPVDTWWVNAACLLLAAGVNLLIVSKRVEVYRSVEIRADCMIVEDTDVFWLHTIEDNWPTLQQDEQDKDRHSLCGIYGNRFVEYVTTWRLNELDRTPEKLAAHLHDAMMKLWGPAQPGMAGPKTPVGRGRFRPGY